MPKSLRDQVYPVTVQMTPMPFLPPSFSQRKLSSSLSRAYFVILLPFPKNNPFSPTGFIEQRRAHVICLHWAFSRCFYLLDLLVLCSHPYQDLQAEVMEGRS